MQTKEIENISIKMTTLKDLGESLNKMQFHKDMFCKYVDKVSQQYQQIESQAEKDFCSQDG